MAKDPKLVAERQAEILIDAYLSGDDVKTAKKQGITRRTLQNYRARLEHDPVLAQIFSEKKSQAADAWLEQVPGALVASVEFLKRAAQEGDPKNPDMVHSVAGAMKLIGELTATWRIVDARVARTLGTTRAPAGALPAGGTAPAASATH